ncbi:MAG: diacylglycerol kinase family protein [Bacteroidales bacterium]
MGLKRTFGNAFRGLGIFLSRESNNRIHLTVASLVIAAGIFFGIDATEWLFVVLSIGLVMTSEAFNFALEKLCDEVRAEYDKQIKVIKDISAGAVLIAALVSVVVGLIIFMPEVMGLIF